MQEELREKIGEGIASLGPTMTLDTLVEILILSIGTIAGEKPPLPSPICVDPLPDDMLLVVL